MTKKEVIILVSIVVFDLVTKLAANYYLPFQEDVFVLGNDVSLYLTYNTGATGGQAEYLVGGENKNLEIVSMCMAGLIVLAYILYIRKRALKTVYKILLGVALYLGVVLFITLLQPYMSTIVISNGVTSVIGKLTGLTLYGSLFWLTRDAWIRFFSLLVLSCGIGNLLSHFYVPYQVIDFININGTYEYLRIGVFNFADLAFDIGGMGLVVSVAALIYRKLRGSRSKSTELTE